MKTYAKYALIALSALVVVSLVVCGGLTLPSEAKGKPPTDTPEPPPPTDTPSGPTATPLPSGAYYVDCSAGTNGDGSQGSPWNDLATVNATIFSAGSSILFKRGTTCSGQLWPKGSGASGSPIVVDAYGTGSKPIIAGGGVPATVYLYNQGYWEITNLEITNVGPSTESLRGVWVVLEDYGTGDYYRVNNLTIHDVTGDPQGVKATGGIIFKVLGTTVQTKFNDVLIEGNVVDGDVNRSGIFTTGWGAWDQRDSVCQTTGGGSWIGWTNVIVRGNTVNDVAGDAIVLINTLDGLVEYNVVSHFQARTTSTATAGIWSWDSTGTVFQYNEAYLSDGVWDGQGFDIDYGNDATIMQYNYSHDNDGGFMLVCTMCEGGNDDGTVRYNVSQNDGIAGQPVFELSGKTTNIKIYNNTIYTTRASGTMLHEWDWNGYTLGTTWNNNIFWNGGGLTYDLYGNQTFDYNIFYGQHPASEPDDPHKITDDPLFVNPGSGGTGIGTVNGYQLQAGSPAIGAGVVIADNGGQDYWGNPIPVGCAPDIGAHQYATECSATPTPPPPPPTTTPPPPTATPDPGDNMVVNPGFETGGLDPWYAWEQAAVVSNNQRSGSYAVAVGTGAASVEQVVGGLSKRTTYVLRGWGKCPSGGDVKIGVKDYGGKQVLNTITSSDYSQAEVWFTTGPNDTSATIFCYNQSGAEIVYCDDFSVIEVP